MANEDTVQLEFYAPWPLFGKKLSEQLGEIRTDTAHLAPIVRGFGLDASGDFSTLDSIEQTAVQAIEIGEQDFHNRFRMHYNKVTDVFELASNTGTSEVPNWYTTWWIDRDGLVTQQNTPTTASNQGSGAGIFKQKSGVDLEFKSLRAFYPLSIREQNSTIDFHTGAERNTYSALTPAVPSGGTGGIENIISNAGKVGVDFPFKAIEAGPFTVVTDTGNTLRIESTSQVVEFYGIVVMHSDETAVFPGVHILKVNPEAFYLTKQIRTNEVLLNSRGDNLNRNEFVEVIGDAMTGQLLMFDGTAAAPAIAFTLETDTGLRRRADNDFAFVTSGVDRLRIQDSLIFATVPLHLPDSTAALPGLAFASDPNTGLYQRTAGSDSIDFTTGGVHAGSFENGSFLTPRITAGRGQFYEQIRVGGGTKDNPGIAFDDDTDTGIYRDSANQAYLVANGANRLRWNNNNVRSFAQHLFTDGLVGAPGIAFASDVTSGLYFSSSRVRVTVAGVLQISWTGTDTHAVGNVFASTGYFQSKQGSASDLAFRFLSATTTGLHGSSGIVNITCAGADKLTIDGSNNRIFGAGDMQFRASGGAAGDPDWSFNSQTDAGMFMATSGGDQLSFAVDGSRAGWFKLDNLFVTGEVYAGDGGAGFPSYSFRASGQTNVGMYRSAEDEISFATGGRQTFLLKNTATDNLQAMVRDGSVALPSLAFISDPNTGIYRSGGDTLDFATAGIRAGYFDSSQNFHVTNDIIAGGDMVIQGEYHTAKVVAGTGLFYEQLRLGDGAAGAGNLALTFISDSDTGLYHAAANSMMFTAGGSSRLRINQNNVRAYAPLLSLTGTLAAPSFGWADDVNTGFFQEVANDGGITIVTDGVKAGKWDPTGLQVEHDVMAGRVEAGIGVFYTQLDADKIRAIRDGSITDVAIGNSDGTVGMYFVGSRMDITIGGGLDMRIQSGTVAFQVSNVALRSSGGTIAAPALMWQLDTDTGLSNDNNDDQIFFSTGGVEAGHFDASQNLHVTGDLHVAGEYHTAKVVAGTGLFYEQVLIGDGTAADPGLAFVSDTNTGLRLSSSGNLRLVINGVDNSLWDSNAFIPLGAVRSNRAGTALLPEYSWQQDNNTGMYNDLHADILGFSTGGTRAGYFDANQNLHVTGDVRSSRVEAGRGVFYTNLEVGDYMQLGKDDGLSHNTDPQFTFAGTGSTSGIGYNYSGDAVQLYVAGVRKIALFSSRIEMHEEVRLQSGTATDPSINFIDDTNTGLYQRALDTMAISTGGNFSGEWMEDGAGLLVERDLVAGRIHSGPALFYTQIRSENAITVSRGKASAPAIASTTSANTGMYWNGSTFTLVSAGTDALSVTATVVRAIQKLRLSDAASVAAPSLQWQSDTNTGISQNVAGDNSIAFVTDGVRAGYFDSDQTLHVQNDVRSSRVEAGIGVFYTQLNTDKIRIDRDGLVGDVAFGRDDNTGIYFSGGNTIHFTAAGGTDFMVKSGSVVSHAQLYAKLSGGTLGANTLAYSFWGDQDTGIYQLGQASNTYAFATGGVRAGYFDSGQDLYVTNEILVPRITAGFGKFYVALEVDGDLTMTTGTILTRADAANPSPLSIAAIDATTTGIALDGVAIRFISDNSQHMGLGFGVVNSNVKHSFVSGTVSAPSLHWNGDANTGIYRSADEEIAFATGGVQAGYFDSNQNLQVTNRVVAQGTMQAEAFYLQPNRGSISTNLNWDMVLDSGKGDGRHLRLITHGSGDILLDADAGEIKLESQGDDITLQNFNSSSADILILPGDELFMQSGGLITMDSPNGFINITADRRIFLKSDSDTIKFQSDFEVQVLNCPINADKNQGVDEPAYSFSGNTGMGMFVAGVGTLGFTTGGSKIAGQFTNTQGLDVTETVKTSRVDSGTGLFYIDATAGRFFAKPTTVFSRPQYSFVGDTDTGLTRSSTADNAVYMLAGGTFRQFWGTSFSSMNVPLRLNDDSTAAAPALLFVDDPNTGIFQRVNGGDDIAFSTGGVEAGYFDSGQDLYVTNELLVPRVTAGFSLFYINTTAGRFFAKPTNGEHLSKPQYSFRDDTDTGMSMNSPTTGLYLSVSGAWKIFMSTTRVQMNVPLMIDDDSTAGTPALHFRDDSNTGIFQKVNAGDDLAFSTGGVEAGYFDDNQNFHVTGDIFATNLGVASISAPEAHFYRAIYTERVHASEFVESPQGFFYESLHIGDGTVAGTTFVRKASFRFDIRQDATTTALRLGATIPEPPLGPFGTILELEVPISFLPNRLMEPSGFGEPDAAFHQECTITAAGESFARYAFITDRMTMDNEDGVLNKFKFLQCNWFIEKGASDTVQTNIQALQVNPTFRSQLDARTPGHIQGLAFTPIIMAQDAHVGTKTDEGISGFIGVRLAPSLQAQGTDSSITIDKYTGVSSQYTQLAVATGEINIGEVVDFDALDHIQTGTGVFGMAERTNFFAQDDTRAPIQYGFRSTINKAGGKFAIHHSGTAASTIGGEFYLRGDLLMHDDISIRADAGTVSLPGITFQASGVTDEDTGLYQPAANQVAMALAGTVTQTWAATYSQFSRTLRLDDSGSPGDVDLVWTSDTNTGFWHDVASGVEASAPLNSRFQAADTFHAVTGGTVAASWDQNQDSWAHGDMNVLNDVHAGRVTAGRGTFYGQVLFDEGTAALPSISFSSDPDIGIWRSATGALQVIAGNSSPSAYMTFGPSNVTVSKILSLNKALSLDRSEDISNTVMYFTNDTDTGVYQRGPSGSGGNTWAWKTAGVEAGWFDGDQTLNLKRLESGFGNFYVECTATRFFAHKEETGGTGDFPGYAFTTDKDTGMYLDLVGDLRLTVGGVPKLGVRSDGILMQGQVIQNNPGTAAAPGYSWNGDKDSGMYQEDEDNDTVSFATAGVYAGGFDSVQNFYVANSVYVKDVIEADKGQFYTSLSLNDSKMKFGSDGILYAWDPTRLKFLSVSRTILTLSREFNDNSAAFVLHTGMISDNNTRGGTVLPRDYTITHITGRIATIAGTGSDTGDAVYIMETMSSAGAQVLIHTATLPFEQLNDPRRNYDSGPLDIDVTKDLTIHMTNDSSPQVTTDPQFQVEIAWRLE